MIIPTTGLFLELCVSDPTREEGGNLNYGPSGAEKATLAAAEGTGIVSHVQLSFANILQHIRSSSAAANTARRGGFGQRLGQTET